MCRQGTERMIERPMTIAKPGRVIDSRMHVKRCDPTRLRHIVAKRHIRRYR